MNDKPSDAGRDRLDDLLDQSAPATGAPSPARTAALARLVRSSAPRGTGTRVMRTAVVGTVTLGALGLGGAAAADALGWSSWWADDAVNEVTFTVPSGAVCTQIIGDVKGSPEGIATLEAFLAQDDLVSLLDLNAAYADLAQDSTYDLNGVSVPAGPGTDYWSEDLAHERAFSIALANAVQAQLDSQGVSGEGVSFAMELSCPDAQMPANWSEPRG